MIAGFSVESGPKILQGAYKRLWYKDPESNRTVPVPRGEGKPMFENSEGATVRYEEDVSGACYVLEYSDKDHHLKWKYSYALGEQKYEGKKGLREYPWKKGHEADADWKQELEVGTEETKITLKDTGMAAHVWCTC